MLQLEAVSAGYGAVEVLHNISLKVDAGEIVSMIGANGGGKSTLMKTISGLIPARGGKIIFEENDVTRTPPHKIVAMGLVQVPEGRHVFAPLSVYENLLLGTYSKYRQLNRQKKAELLDFVFNLFPILAQRKTQTAGTLSGGEQQMLSIGRALMAQPKLLLLDEPSLGLAPTIVEAIFEVLQQLNRQGVTIFMVEQNALIALTVAHRAYVLSTGRVVLQGKAEELLHDATVKEVYLGETVV